MLSALVFVCVLRRCLFIRIRLGIIRVLSSIRIFSSAFYPPSALSHPRFILHPHFLIRVLSSIRIFSSVFSHPHPYPPSVSAFYPYPKKCLRLLGCQPGCTIHRYRRPRLLTPSKKRAKFENPRWRLNRSK